MGWSGTAISSRCRAGGLNRWWRRLHAGHADIIRERIDGTAGLRAGNDNLALGDEARWRAHHDRLEQLARDAGGS